MKEVSILKALDHVSFTDAATCAADNLGMKSLSNIDYFLELFF